MFIFGRSDAGNIGCLSAVRQPDCPDLARADRRRYVTERGNGGEETFDLVVFSSYEVVERTPYLGETRAWIGDATWKPLERATVEMLVGERYSVIDGPTPPELVYRVPS